MHLNSERYNLEESEYVPDNSLKGSVGGAGMEWQIGPFSACPMQQKGCVARFSRLEFGPRKEAAHSTDVSEMTDK